MINKRYLAVCAATTVMVGTAFAANVTSKVSLAKPSVPVVGTTSALRTTTTSPMVSVTPPKVTTPAPVHTVAGTTTTTVATTAKALPPLDLSDMALWNWNGKWMGSDWGNGSNPLPWKYDHISQPAKGDTYFTLDAKGAPELQAMNGISAYSRGLWETDVTLPTLKSGVVVAPLWLYDSVSHDEIDFELAGRYGLDVTVHANVNGTMQQQTIRLFAGQDLSGQRHRFGIKLDETAGYAEMYVDGRSVHRFDRSAMPLFVSHPMKPLIEMWAADPKNSGYVYWVGAWQGLAANEALRMTVHGYGYTPIP